MGREKAKVRPWQNPAARNLLPSTAKAGRRVILSYKQINQNHDWGGGCGAYVAELKSSPLAYHGCACGAVCQKRIVQRLATIWLRNVFLALQQFGYESLKCQLKMHYTQHICTSYSKPL